MGRFLWPSCFGGSLVDFNFSGFGVVLLGKDNGQYAVFVLGVYLDGRRIVLINESVIITPPYILLLAAAHHLMGSDKYCILVIL